MEEEMDKLLCKGFGGIAIERSYHVRVLLFVHQFLQYRQFRLVGTEDQ